MNAASVSLEGQTETPKVEAGMEKPYAHAARRSAVISLVAAVALSGVAGAVDKDKAVWAALWAGFRRRLKDG